MKFIFPILTHIRSISMIENIHTYVFKIPLFKTEFDTIPILPKIVIKDDSIYIICIKKDNKKH